MGGVCPVPVNFLAYSRFELAYNWSNYGDLPSCKPRRESVKSINLERFFGHKSVLYILLASVI